MTETLIARLRTADPDRLAMALLAPRAARARLLTLYALNDELARTALAARDPLIAEMRVRWWADRLERMAEGPPPPHELLGPVWEAWGPDAARLAPVAEARMHDAAREPLPGQDAVIAYADATGGALMTLAADAAGLDAASTPIAAMQGRGAALIAWLRARPALQALGLGLAKPDAAQVQALGDAAQTALGFASSRRADVPPPVAPVLFAGTGLRAALAAARAGRNPGPPSDFARRGALARLALTGRWWL